MHSPGQTLSTKQVLLCGALIVTLSMGIRHGFGLWLQPITQAQGWTRETFSFALAIQNLSWGIFGIFAGMAADRFGAFRVFVVGAVAYAHGQRDDGGAADQHLEHREFFGVGGHGLGGRERRKRG